MSAEENRKISELISDQEIDDFAFLLHAAWGKYTASFGEAPHGTLPQMKALVALNGHAIARYLARQGRPYPLRDFYDYQISCETNKDGRGRPAEWRNKEMYDWNHTPQFAAMMRDNPAHYRNIVLKRRPITRGFGDWEEISIEDGLLDVSGGRTPRG